jgi:hypothetical protein
MRTYGILALLIVTVLLVGTAVADKPAVQDTPASVTSVTTDQIESVPTPPPFQVLRHAEDYSVLGDGPRATWLDELKYMSVICPDLRLTVGGQARVRYEYKHNEVFGSGRPASDGYLLTRFRVHADLNYRDTIRIFAEGKFAHAFDRDRPAPRIFEDDADFQNLFVDVTPWRDGKNKLTFRVGRQELLYGRQRLASSFVWANVMRTFDGAKAMLTLEDAQGGVWQIDGWWSRLVRIRKGHFNDPDHRTQFYGLYASYNGPTKWGTDLYALGVEQNGRTNQNGRMGTDHRMTLGGRFWTKDFAPWDFEAEGAWQVGEFAGDDVSAWTAGVEGGYTFQDCAVKPRVWVGYEFASGDSDPSDGKVGTFNQMFPLGHAWFGYVDVVGRQNVHNIRTGVDMKLLKNLSAGVHVHNFWLAEESDALYNAGGAPLRRDATGSSGSYVGSEIDLIFKLKIDRHSSVVAGYSHFFTGTFIEGTGPDDDVDFTYVQYQFTF